MTEETNKGRSAVAGVIRGVARKTALIVAAAAAVALAIVLAGHDRERWWFVPLSILSGGALGLVNFRWLAVSVERLYLRKGATKGLANLAAVIISILKLSFIFIVLYVIIKWQLLHLFGLVAGLSLCFLAILWEGVTAMKETLRNSGQ